VTSIIRQKPIQQTGAVRLALSRWWKPRVDIRPLPPHRDTLVQAPTIHGEHQIEMKLRKPGRARYLGAVRDAIVLGNICAALIRERDGTFDFLSEGPDMDLGEGLDYAEIFPADASGRRGCLFNLTPVRHTPRAILAGTRYTNNYFHFIAEGLSRIELADSEPGLAGVPLVFGDLPNAPSELIRLLWPDRPLIQLSSSEVLAVDELAVPHSACYSPLSGDTDNATFDVELLGRVRRRLEPHLIDLWSRPGDLLHLSRAAVKDSKPEATGQRQLLNEQAVERLVAGRGGLIVHPQTQTLHEQMALFAGAEVIVAQAGAALANILFCRPGARLVMLCRDRRAHPEYFGLLADLCGVRVHAVTGPADVPDDPDPHASFTVDLALLAGVLDREGVAQGAA
jgi:hypothetical protein